MNLVKDYLDVVSSTVCDICGVDGGKIQLVNGQRFNVGTYCYGSIEIKDMDFRARLLEDAQCKTRLEKQCKQILSKRFGYVGIEIKPGIDTGYVNVVWELS
jgi:hypothetical protein